MTFRRVVFHASLFFVALSASCLAQTPGQNINMVSGTTFPTGDPYLQRQNEPSIAASSRNSSRLLAGSNDYRSVNIPAPAGVMDETGDAWLGVFKSTDGGATWQSNLLPGYPQDVSPEGLASPLHGFTTGADPVVRAGTNGMFYYTGIAFDRGTNIGAVFVARYIDLANKENGDAIAYLDTTAVEHGTATEFIDKPWVAVDIPRGTATCTIQTMQDGKPVSQTIPAGTIYVAYTAFIGGADSANSRLRVSHSIDCGQSWSKPITISSLDGDEEDEEEEGGPTQVNQGASIAIDPQTGTVYIAWRSFVNGTLPNAVRIAKSTDGGVHFSKPVTVKTLPSFDPSNPGAPAFFDQSTSNSTFRSNGYPSLTIDGSGDGSGRLYLAWSQFGVGPNGDARIVLTTSLDGVTWTAPQPVDNSPVADDFGGMFARGEQFMPSLTFSQGKLMALYYDQRLDHTVGDFTPNSPFMPNVATGSFYEQARNFIGDLPGSPNAVYTPFISDFGLTIRHTLDVRVSEADPGATPTFTSAEVSQYKFGTLGDEQPAGTVTQLQQLQVNPPNLPMFMGGTVPFMGDYIDITGPAFRTPGETGAGWQFNTAATQSPVYFSTYTSNQDVRPPADLNWAHYTPPGAGCIPGQEGDKNQNIYFSRITQGLFFSSPQINKPLTTTIQRAFVLELFNGTDLPHSFKLTISHQPAGGSASFDVAPSPLPAVLPPPTTFIYLTLAPRSGATRSVFATSTNASEMIPVSAAEIVSLGGALKAGGLTGAVVLNSDTTVPALVNPDGSPGDINLIELYTPNLSNPNLSNPNLSNPNLSNPNLSNPNLSNPNLSNPNLSNPNLSNPNFSNANVTNANVANPNLSNPNLSNPNLSNPNLSNASISDVTYTVSNNGNTNSAYQVKLVQLGGLPSSAHLQLILSKTYLTPIGDNCQLLQEQTILPVTNVVNPTFIDFTHVGDNTSNGSGTDNATLHLAPGETALVTIRGAVDLPTMQMISNMLIPAVRAQGAFTDDNLNKLALPLTLIPAMLTNAIAGQGYSTSFVAIGGKAPYTWSVAPESQLPPGFTLNPNTGVLANSNPGQNVAGTYTFSLQITDSSQPANVATRSYTLQVIAPVKITTTSLNDGVVNQPYAFTVMATGGISPLVWSVVGGSLPETVSLNSQTGVIAGSVSAPGSFTFTVRATDSSQPTALFDQRTFTLRFGAPLAFSFPSLPDAVNGKPYVFTLTAMGGFAPYFWSLNGALPTGLMLNPTGVITGTPTVTNTAGFTFMLNVNDSSSPQQGAGGTFVIHVANLLQITTASVPNAKIRKPYKTMLQASGGLAPLSWSLFSGGLPPGLTLTKAGVIGGLPTKSGTFAFTVKVVDSSSPQQAATRSYKIVVGKDDDDDDD